MKIRHAIAFVSTLFICSSNASITIGDVLDASPIISKHLSDKQPLQFGKPIEVEVDGVQYTSRFFFYHNPKNPDATLGSIVSKSELEIQNLDVTTQSKDAISIRSSHAMIESGVSFAISLNPTGAIPAVKPTLGQVLKACETMRNYKHSPLTYPGSPESIITLKGKNYQIRYFMFQKEMDFEPITFAEFVKDEKLHNIKLQPRNDGYADLLTLIATEDMKERGIKLVLSLALVQK